MINYDTFRTAILRVSPFTFFRCSRVLLFTFREKLKSADKQQTNMSKCNKSEDMLQGEPSPCLQYETVFRWRNYEASYCYIC